jgi:hypothetical protein
MSLWSKGAVTLILLAAIAEEWTVKTVKTVSNS